MIHTHCRRLTVDPLLTLEVNNVLESVIAQMNGITSGSSADNVKLGPVLTAKVAVEGKSLKLCWILDLQSHSRNYKIESPFRNPGKATSLRPNNI